ncbi:hypothetical protein Ancab_026922 [Ancistrocladus abbreviatus]
MGNLRQDSYDHKYYEKVGWKNFSHVCTAPVESDEDLSIVTGAQLQVGDYGFKKVLFLRLRFSTVLGATVSKASRMGWITSHHFTSVPMPPPRPADVNINSAVYPGGPPFPVQTPKLLKFVDTTEMTRGPQETPGYWVVSGARLVVEKGKISLQVKYSLLTVILPDDEELEESNMKNGIEGVYNLFVKKLNPCSCICGHLDEAFSSEGCYRVKTSQRSRSSSDDILMLPGRSSLPVVIRFKSHQHSFNIFATSGFKAYLFSIPKFCSMI